MSSRLYLSISALLMLLVGSSLPLQAARPALTLTTAALPPLGPSSTRMGFLQRVLESAFDSIGYDVEIIVLPGERALLNANSGLDDGDAFRAPGFEDAYPNLIRVPEKIGVMEFMAYSSPGAKIGRVTWKGLRDYTVAYANGWKIYERNVQAEEVTVVRNIKYLFPLLEQERADIVLLDRWQGLYMAKKQGVKVKLLEPPLAKVDMYMYLHKKHDALVSKVVTVLRKMKQDGTYDEIMSAELEQHNYMSN
ncbi:MAG: transporter substrate-binding domain-containing protein [Gammaproteobacteria bacterium]|nr:transporter substrate-binding domain-containing protein [Gammaproteobacteria bacterium]